MPIHSSLDSSSFKVTTFIEDCSHSNPGRSDCSRLF